MSDRIQRLCDTFVELARIPSPSRRERAAADEVARRVRELGYEVEEDDAGRVIGGDAGNLLVRVPGRDEGPTLLLCAHLDTVEAGDRPLEPVRRGREVSARGETITGADDKCGVAVLLELLARLREEETPPRGGLRVLFTVAEEIELLGISAVREEWLAGVDAALALDHSRPGELVIAAPHKVALRVTVRGVGGHAAFPERRVNAAHALATAVSRLPSGRLDDYSTANLGVVRAGERINVIPGTAYAEYELRSHHKDLLDFHLTRTLATIEGAVREARVMVLDAPAGIGDDGGGERADPLRKATVEVEVEACYAGYRLAGDALPVKLHAAAAAACGCGQLTVVAQGGSDANVLNARGVPAAVMGCGMHGAHSPRERADLEEMARAVEMLLVAVRE